MSKLPFNHTFQPSCQHFKALVEKASCGNNLTRRECRVHLAFQLA